jgi:hypothetical protein
LECHWKANSWCDAGGARVAANAGPAIPQEMNAESPQFRDFLSGEFTRLHLAELMAVLHAREAGRAIKN